MIAVDRVSAASFIGRAPELAELEAALADAREGRPRLVFLAGESGVGKSRLLSEFRRRAAAGGAQAIGGESIDLGDDELPYAPLVGAVRPLARDRAPVFGELTDAARSELARLAPELGDAASERGEDREGEAQRRLFDALLSLLEHLGQEHAAVFWLEDIHWADRSTRAFLAFLEASLREERVLVVATYRSDELHRRHPLRPLLGELERGPCSRRIELRRFDRDELSEQLADILGATPEDDLVDRLYSRSEGNALFTEELLAGGLDGRGTLPPTLREALLTRLERLEDGQRATIGLLAVAGRADDALLAEATEGDAAAVRDVLRDALALHLVRSDDDGRFAFRHALIREVVYDDLLPGERSELHLALARRLEERADSGEDGVWIRTAVAHHFHSAGEQRDALRTALAAAERSEAHNAFGEASGLLDRALALWPRVDGAEELVGCDLPATMMRAAQAHFLDGGDDRCANLMEQAVDLVDPEVEPLRAAELLGELARVRWSLGHGERSRETLDRALALVPDDATEQRVRLLAHQMRFRFLQGRYGDVAEIGPRAIALAESAGMTETKATAMNRVGFSYFPLGEPERGERMILEGIELARAEGTEDQVTSYVNYADLLHIVGRTDDALAFLDSIPADFEVGYRGAIWLGLIRAEIEFARGDWAAAEAAMPQARGLSPSVTRVNLELRVAEQALGRGDLARARDVLASAWNVVSHSLEPQFIAAVAVLRTDLELRERNVDAARAVAEEGLDKIQFCTEDGTRIAKIAAAATSAESAAAQLARDVGDSDAERAAAERAQMLVAMTEASVEEWSGPVERALLDGARADAAAAAGDVAEGPAWLTAAAGWALATRPYEEARARLRAAEALAADDREAAAGELEAARAAARRLGSRWLAEEAEAFAARARIALAGAPEASADPDGDETDAGERFGLTARERQVLTLVASGATNREIGEQLFMAEKTASVHVSRIMAKLGVKSRTEAAAVAVRQGLAEPVA